MKILLTLFFLLFSFSTLSNEQKLYQPILDNIPVIDFENEVYMNVLIFQT